MLPLFVYAFPQQEPGTHPFLPGVPPQQPCPCESGNEGVSLPVSEDVTETILSVLF